MSSHLIDSLEFCEKWGNLYFRIRCDQISTEFGHRSLSINSDEVITCKIYGVDASDIKDPLFDFKKIKLTLTRDFGTIINVMGKRWTYYACVSGGWKDDEDDEIEIEISYRPLTPGEIARHDEKLGVLKSKGHNPNAKPYHKKS